MVDEVRDGDALPGTHIRVCQIHGAELDDNLFCSGGGGHFTQRWNVVNTEKGRAVAAVDSSVAIGEHRGVDAIQDLEGMKVRTNKGGPLLQQQQEASRKAVVMRKEPTTRQRDQRRKFSSPAGDTLVVKLVKTGTGFRVRWWHSRPNKDRAGQNITSSGVSAIAPEEQGAQALFRSHCEDARKLKWVEVPAGRTIDLKAIPRPLAS